MLMHHVLACRHSISKKDAARLILLTRIVEGCGVLQSSGKGYKVVKNLGEKSLCCEA